MSLEVDNKDPLPENMANVGTIHCAAESIGNQIDPIICLLMMENYRNVKGLFKSISWKIIVEADELEIFKVRNFLINLISY